MKRLVKPIVLLLSISLTGLLPAKSSSAQDFLSLENTVSDVNTIQVSSFKGKSFDPDVKFNKFHKDILQNESFTYSVEEADADYSYSFSSADSSILKVKQLSDTSCRYTGVSSGTTNLVIKIKKDNGFFLFDQQDTIRKKITVSPRAVSIVFDKKTVNIKRGKKHRLSYTIRPSISTEEPNFHSSNTKVATVNNSGVVTAVKAGTSYITATLSNGKSAKCKILVKNPVSD